MTQSSLAAAPEAMVVVPPSVPKKPQVLRINIRYALLGTALLLLIIAVYEVYWFLSLPKERVGQTPQSRSSPNGRTKPVLLPLTITSATPEPNSEFVIKEGARQKFSIQATSTAKGVLRYVWYLNGKEQVSSGNEWIYEPSFEEGDDNIKTVDVTIIDSGNQKVNQHGKDEYKTSIDHHRFKVLLHPQRLSK